MDPLPLLVWSLRGIGVVFLAYALLLVVSRGVVFAMAAASSAGLALGMLAAAQMMVELRRVADALDEIAGRR